MKDILLHLPTYPEPLPPEALQAALDVAVVLDGHVTGLVSEPKLGLPLTFHPYPQEMLEKLKAEQNALEHTAQKQLEKFEDEARRRSLAFEGRIVQLPDLATSSLILDFARLRNLTVLPHFLGTDLWDELAQDLIFGAGRPVLVLPAKRIAHFQLDNIVVAWDFSRAASRAVEDALPLLRKAKEVRAVIVKHEKWLGSNPSGPEFTKHLARNGVSAVLQEVDLGERTIGEALDDLTSEADLLVMGAFGHSRLRDFFLGGATRHMLQDPKLPIFLSH